jgi:hypothetical protein
VNLCVMLLCAIKHRGRWVSSSASPLIRTKDGCCQVNNICLFEKFFLFIPDNFGLDLQKSFIRNLREKFPSFGKIVP